MDFKLIDVRLYSNKKNTKYKVPFKQDGKNTAKVFHSKEEAVIFRDNTSPLNKNLQPNHPASSEVISEDKKESAKKTIGPSDLSLVKEENKEIRVRKITKRPEMEIHEIEIPDNTIINESNYIIVITKDPKVLENILAKY
jgi:hypothetical protein